MTEKEQIAGRIKSRMQALGMTQEQLAAKVGAKQSTVSRWINGVNAPTGIWLRRLATALEATADYLSGATGLPGQTRREATEELLAGILGFLDQVAAGGSPRTLELSDGETIPVPEVGAGDWPEQLKRIEDYLNHEAGGDWRSLSKADREAFVYRLAALALRHVDDKRRQ